MKRSEQPVGKRWFLLTLVLSCVTLLALVFSLWELVEHHYFRGLDYATLHYLYITRGIASSLLIGLWAGWYVLRERRRHEQELEQSCDHYRSILNSTPDAVVLFDDSFRVLEWNAAAERLYGFAGEQVLGQQLPTVPPEGWLELKEILARLEHEEEVLDHETWRCTARGEQIPIAASYSRMPRTNSHSPLHLEVAQDIRPRLRLRDKLLEVEKLALMGQMAAGIAHHLNTPLTAMLLQIQMLGQRIRESEDASELASMEKQIHFCRIFVQDLLRFARRSQLHRKPVFLRDVLEATTIFLRPNLRLKKASLQVDVDGIGQCQVLGDASHLEIVFSALISNALAAAPEGGSVWVSGAPAGEQQVEIRIDDNGEGIPDQLLPRVFEPFFTTKPAGQGTGLGLAISRNVIEDHGGTLHLENLPGGGVRAAVRLPLLQGVGAGQESLKERSA